MIPGPHNPQASKYAAALALIAAASIAFAAGGTPGPSALFEEDSRGIHRFVRDFQTLALDPAGTVEQVRSTGYLSLPLREGTVSMLFAPQDLRSPAHVAEETGADGGTRAIDLPFAGTYKGEVLGIEDAQARFTFDEGRVEGLILTPGEWYYVEPLRNYEPSASPAEIVIYRRSDIRFEAIGVCGASLAHRIGRAEKGLSPQALEAPGTIRVAQVATEADYEYVTALGDSTRASNEILQIMNQVSGIYETELGISLEVVYQHAWATAVDPYATTEPGGILGEFRNHWVANYSGIAYDLAHMWTGKNMDGSTVGIAWLGVLCNARGYSYGVSQRLTSTPGKIIVTAHEIGHNFGATHTDQASPPPASCENTIMNSSIGTALSFCEFSRSEVADHLSGNSSCLTQAASPCDINLDGTSNIADIQLLVNVILGSAGCPGGCDVNQDGKVDVLDVQVLCNVILGLRSCP